MGRKNKMLMNENNRLQITWPTDYFAYLGLLVRACQICSITSILENYMVR